MKKLRFRSHLAKEILEGRKTVTWRLFDDKDLMVGDKFELIIWETGKKFAEAEIIKVREKKFGKLDRKDLEGHEKFKNKEEMLKTYREYYGGKVNQNTIVKIIEFRLLRG